MNEPIAKVVATGGPHDKEDRVLVEMVAELPPAGTLLYAGKLHTMQSVMAAVESAEVYRRGIVLTSNQCRALAEQLNKQATEAVPQKYDDTLLPFLDLMRKELHANAHKGDRDAWIIMTHGELLLETFYHVGKLQGAIKNRDHDRVAEYAADVANLAMMTADVFGLLGEYK